MAEYKLLTMKEVAERYSCAVIVISSGEENRLCTKAEVENMGLTVVSPSPCDNNLMVTETNRCRSLGGRCHCS